MLNVPPCPSDPVITTIVLIRVEPSLTPTAANMLAGVDGVTEVYSVSGDWDLVAIVRVAEYDQIARVVTEIFPTVPGIQRTQTLTAFRAYSSSAISSRPGISASSNSWLSARRAITSRRFRPPYAAFRPRYPQELFDFMEPKVPYIVPT